MPLVEKKILLVEDDPKLRYVLQTLLEQRGCKLKVCEDAKCVRELDGEHTFDTAIVDVRLPLELGTDLARFLSQKYANLKIVFITGYDNLERFEHRLDGASLLVKPFDFETLWNLI